MSSSNRAYYNIIIISLELHIVCQIDNQQYKQKNDRYHERKAEPPRRGVQSNKQ